MQRLLSIAAAITIGVPLIASADVVSSSDTHFVLRHEAVSSLAADELWQRLVQPAAWWHPDHTYSGSSDNLSLEPVAGGVWKEEWEGGSVVHGTVIYVREGRVLRMNAPFGPLQELGAYTIWTITVSPDGNGSRVVFDEVSSGPPSANLPELAEAVDFVKTEAIGRLTRE